MSQELILQLFPPQVVNVQPLENEKNIFINNNSVSETNANNMNNNNTMNFGNANNSNEYFKLGQNTNNKS